MTTKEILKEEFDLLAYDLIEKHKQLGMKSRGKWIDSLEVEIGEEKAVLIGADYTEQLEFGRNKGKFPPISMIKEWILNKRLKFDIPISSLAFLIARKISKKGYQREKFGGVELVSLVLTERRIDSIIKRIGNQMTISLIKKIEDTYKASA